jgi:VIT1/CCC1 family predicted Fe2+/Mn2+ transporter
LAEEECIKEAEAAVAAEEKRYRDAAIPEAKRLQDVKETAAVVATAELADTRRLRDMSSAQRIREAEWEMQLLVEEKRIREAEATAQTPAVLFAVVANRLQ